MTAHAMANIEKQMIKDIISKTGTTKAKNGHRFFVTSAHGREIFSQSREIEESEIPAFSVAVQRKKMFMTNRGNMKPMFCTVRSFLVDGFTLKGLKQFDAEFHA